MKPAFFTVVIPSYNRAHLIPKAIKSVLCQTFTDWELIIADDCSTDDTERVVEQFLSEKVRFFSNEKNKGNAGARNLGAKLAKGDYVCFLDSDDQYHSDFLQKMYDLIHEKKFPDFLWCKVNRFDEENDLIDSKSNKKWNPLEQQNPYVYFLKGLNFGTDHGFTVKRNCFSEVGLFDENLRTAVDTDFILRLVQNCSFNYSDEILVDTYDHPGERVRKDTSSKLLAYEILFKKHQQTITQHNELEQYWFNKLMWLNYHNNKKSRARKFLYKSFKVGNYKALSTALLFEFLPKTKAVDLHKKISEKIKDKNHLD